VGTPSLFVFVNGLLLLCEQGLGGIEGVVELLGILGGMLELGSGARDLLFHLPLPLRPSTIYTQRGAQADSEFE
jgi:hypothetical protein